MLQLPVSVALIRLRLGVEQSVAFQSQALLLPLSPLLSEPFSQTAKKSCYNFSRKWSVSRTGLEIAQGETNVQIGLAIREGWVEA